MSQLDYPFHFDTRGRTAETSDDEHIRDMIEQVLFTAPGERVNRPTFGCGLMQLVFAPNSDALAATSQFLVQGALQQWLGDLIVVEAVQVEADDSTLRRHDSISDPANADAARPRSSRAEGRRMIYFCCDQLRRNELVGSAFNGIDYLEVLDDESHRSGTSAAGVSSISSTQPCGD